MQPYDPISQQFTDYVGGAVTEWALGYPAVAAELGALRDTDVLDFGCGGGNFAAFLADRGARVLGADVSAEMIALARSRHGGGRYFTSSAPPPIFPRWAARSTPRLRTSCSAR